MRIFLKSIVRISSEMTSQSSTVLLNRLLSLKENSPFLLVLDSLIQSSSNLVNEFAYNAPGNKVVYLSYETLNKPKYAEVFIDCTVLKASAIVNQVKREIPASTGLTTSKTLIIIDSLNYIPNDELTQFISSLIGPSTVILGTYHTNVPEASNLSYPSPISLLTYIASSIFEVEPFTSLDDQILEERLNNLDLPVNSSLNSTTFKVILTNRRKSGRSLEYKYKFDVLTHVYEVHKEEEVVVEDEESMLKGLTTFNLTTNSKQRLAREQVELPYMEAQETLGSAGGAIVYEFEKDDDYDEEDPYEDPF